MESSDIVWAHLHEVEMFSRGLFRLTPFPSCFYFRFKTNLGSHPFIFSVFMWRHHIRKLKITCPSEVSVPSDKTPYRTLTFHNVLARQGSSFCNRARLNFQAFALRDTKVAAQKGCCVGQKMSYRFSFC